jgi:nucleotidyltransferase substrate binding protein (TIGR01987 family)
MKQENDIRWIQRFNNFKKALKKLNDACNESQTRELNDLEKQGFIKAFEFTFELSWLVIKDYFEYQGNPNIRGSRDAFKIALKYDIIENSKSWFKMIEARNITSHTYEEDIIDSIILTVKSSFITELNSLERKMKTIENENQ